jgi:hypothetical protein
VRHLTTAQLLMRIGFTAIFVGYLMVWLPQPLAGLSFIGIEIGEWVKFLPQVRSSEIWADRNLFYLPPITLALMMILWTAGWSNQRWQTWALRGMAVLIAMLALPALEAVRFEPVSEWLLRLLLLATVLVSALIFPLTERLPKAAARRAAWLAIILLGLLGLIMPTWAYLTVRPAVSELFRSEVGIGPGVWLNAAGHLAAVVAGTLVLFRQPDEKRRQIRASQHIGDSF